jgi:hypothetical protein
MYLIFRQVLELVLLSCRMSSTKDVELLVLRHEVACSAAPANDHALDARIPHVVPARSSAADVVRLVRRWPAERRGTRLCVVEGRPETLECRCSPLGVLHHPPVAESVENLDSSSGAFGSSSL